MPTSTAPNTTSTTSSDPKTHDAEGGMSYGRFAAMIGTSTVLMFGLMYLNTLQLSHVWWSETRSWMAIYMGAVMALIMLGFMWRSYRSTMTNWMIVAGAIAVFAGSLFLVRSQATVTDTDYMKAMIPHHSIAILTSSRADIDDVRVRELADEIIAAQEREIAEMEWLINDIADNGVATTPDEGEQRPVPDFSSEQ